MNLYISRPTMQTDTPIYTVLDANYQSRVHQSFARQQIMHTLGIRMKNISPGQVELHMPHNKNSRQQHGYIHAGVIATALDSACGYAALSLMPAEFEVLTVEFKVNLLRPANGENFTISGTVIRPGKTISVAAGKAYAIAGNTSKLIATMSATLIAMPISAETTTN